MLPSLMVAVGGAAGSVARYWTGLAAIRVWPTAFPWGTLVINVAGSFIIGWFGALSAASGACPASTDVRLLVLVGFCGGYTTFSSFSLQTVELLRAGNWIGASANIILSVTFCMAAVLAGTWAAGLPRPLTPA